MACADVIFRIHTVDCTGRASADDNLLRIDVEFVSVLDEPGCRGINILDTYVNRVLERVVAFRRGDERFAVPASGRAKAVVDGHTYPSLLAKMVIEGIAKSVYAGTHCPGSAKGIEKYRTFFILLVLELVDIHKDRF